MAPSLEPELEELHQSEGRLQAVIQSAPVGILEVDLRGRVIRWNPAAEQIFGWPPEEIIGQPVKIVPPSKQAEFQDVLATVRSGRRYPNVETYRQRKDGSLVDVELAAAPVRDSSGRVVSHMVVFTDITERKRQERELHASRARIVRAADTERRRLERNLHDGAQQRLVGLVLLLRLAGAALDQDPPGARRALDEGLEELGLALGELRELALVDQAQLEQLTADRRREHSRFFPPAASSAMRTASAGSQLRNVTPSAGVASSGWWVRTKIGPSQAPPYGR